VSYLLLVIRILSWGAVAGVAVWVDPDPEDNKGACKSEIDVKEFREVRV
jgi:hypothetical protein